MMCCFERKEWKLYHHHHHHHVRTHNVLHCVFCVVHMVLRVLSVDDRVDVHESVVVCISIAFKHPSLHLFIIHVLLSIRHMNMHSIQLNIHNPQCQSINNHIYYSCTFSFSQQKRAQAHVVHKKKENRAIRIMCASYPFHFWNDICYYLCSWTDNIFNCAPPSLRLTFPSFIVFSVVLGTYFRNIILK